MMPIDSYHVIKRPRFSCDGGCGKVVEGGIEGMDLVVLEHKPSSALLFLCSACASSRSILDHIADKLSVDVDRNVDI